MGMWVGRGRKARAAYGFDDIALVPGALTINPCGWSLKWVVSPSFAMGVGTALESSLPVIGSLARAAITISHDGVRPAGSAVATTPSGDVFVRLEGVVDFEAERQRLRKEIERSRKEIAFLEGKLGRPEFVERAPAEVVERERERMAFRAASYCFNCW